MSELEVVNLTLCGWDWNSKSPVRIGMGEGILSVYSIYPHVLPKL